MLLCFQITCVVEQRILGLKKSFLRVQSFHCDYRAFLEDVISKGYAEKVPQHQLKQPDGKVWPNKGTLWVVFDCGAEFKGTSLNNQLLQGPNLTSSLVGVLTIFRLEPVAVMADIKAIFHQARVVDFLRFLWWLDINQELVEYRMTVHLFGAVSSPSCTSSSATTVEKVVG